jgi:UDP-N-acetyl-D-mannosaminuronic acid dehydrogenase
VRLQPAPDAIDDADIVVLLVDHDQFRSLSRSRLEGKIVYDTRGLWR